MTNLKLAIDWTPNINHIGFFVAQELGFYAKSELDVEIVSPAIDNYQETPAKKVELGKADVALCPFESILSYRVKDNPSTLMALASIYKEDVSAIVVKDSTIKSPKDLDDKSYASYKARYEDKIVQQMIENDGGKGAIQILYPDKLGIWDTVLNNKADATWIFMNWEAVQAKEQNLDLRYFKMKDFGIPYSYSPVLIAEQENINIKKEAIRKFVQTTKKGFLYAKNNPKEACTILAKHVPEHDQNINLIGALEYSTPHFGTDSDWGIMELHNVNTFLKWLNENELENKKFQADELLTNEFLN